MYGGGFATIPAFLADMFGAQNVGAIHGVLLTAWSAAAIAGPVIITELSIRAKANLAPGASKIHIYDQPLRAGGVAGCGLRPHAAGAAHRRRQNRRNALKTALRRCCLHVVLSIIQDT